MPKETVVRFMQVVFVRMAKFFKTAGDNEAQVFKLCSYAEGPNTRIFLVSNLLIPDQNDIEDQTGASIAPTAEFQAIAYLLADDLGLDIFDSHTHPFCEVPYLSGIDFHHGTENAKYISEHLEKSTMGMLVFGRSMQAFDGRVWNRADGKFESIDKLEVMGSPTVILDNTEPVHSAEEDPYARQRIIPGWQQDNLEKLKVSIVGLGGNGALVLAACLALGIGRRGWVKACDADKLEASNLPRIPYAFPEDVGKPKAQIAQDYAAKKAPETPVTCYQESIQSEEMRAIAKEAHVIIGAVDNDGARKIINSLAVRYLIPYLDMGTEIIPDGSSCEAAGQVCTVIPGQTGCLMCTGLIDVSQAALDLLSEEQQAQRAQRGYVRGTNLTPVPSVLPLNGVTSYMAMSQLVRLVFGENPSNSEFLNYDQQKYQLLAAAIKPNPNCPVCGKEGYLGAGDEIIPQNDGPKSTQTFQLSKGYRIDKDNDTPLQTEKNEGDENCDSKNFEKTPSEENQDDIDNHPDKKEEKKNEQC